jgi:nucleoside-diphosphate-sugar epimerase
METTHADRFAVQDAPADEKELEEWLSRPTPGVLETLSRLDGAILVLGVAGKMGPTLARMIRRGLDALGKSERVFGAARFSDPATSETLQSVGVETIRCDLLDRGDVQRLPDAPNVIYMAGQKFGTSAEPERTWAMNTVAPALAAERFAASRLVVFSTGCVYPNVPVSSGGSRETDPLEPLGEYANACVGRERVFAYFAQKHATPLLLFRLNYAIDLRYGVLTDVAQKVARGLPIDLTTGYVNVIWQGDANARAIQCLEYAARPPLALNVTGAEIVSVRALAARFGERLGTPPVFTGKEAETALLSDVSESYRLFGPPTVTLEQMTHRVAQWVQRGGHTLNRPTHFETRDGRY